MEIFYAPILPFLVWPWLGFVVAAVFAWGFVRLRRSGRRGGWPVLVAAVVWAAYGVYETAMHRWSETVVAPIRIDLLVIVPELYAFLIAGVVSWWRRAKTKPAGPEGPTG